MALSLSVLDTPLADARRRRRGLAPRRPRRDASVTRGWPWAARGPRSVVPHGVDRGDGVVAVDLDLDLGAVGLDDVRLIRRARVQLVSTRSTVPWTLASAAARTFASTSPVSSFSVLPLTDARPGDGSRCGWPCWVLDEAVGDEDVVGVVAALANAAPPMAAAPTTAPVTSLETDRGHAALPVGLNGLGGQRAGHVVTCS